MFISLYANQRGELLDYPQVEMLGRSGNNWMAADENEMIPLPKGASLISIPGYAPVGMGRDQQPICLERDPNDNQPISAVAALLPQGFTRTLMPAGVPKEADSKLPLFGYAAVGIKGEKIYVAAVQTDEHRKWHPVYYNTEGLPYRINQMLKKFPHNRIIRQLARCSLEYSCFTAQNIFYQRWEGGIPTMIACNADCIGCISESHAGVDSPQHRINFTPEVEEIAEVGVEHLKNAPQAIISFGQGCEGEPSLNALTLSQAIKSMREKTSRGTINMNTNAGYTRGVKMMADAGMDAMRVTIFSCLPQNYSLYHRPKDYSLSDVINSINYAADKGVKVALNLLTFPGFTDREEEVKALLKLVRENQVDMIQLRNLNLDPDLVTDNFGSSDPGMGIVNFLAYLQEEIPGVKMGSYTHPVR